MAPPSLPLTLLLVCFVVGGAGKAAARHVPVEFLYPPFNLNFLDTSDVFLLSGNATFSAAVYNGSGGSDDRQSRFFFSVLHHDSRTPVWTATAGSTILQAVVLFSLTASGLALSDPASPYPAWSTPPLASPVAALRLLDTGELALLDGANATLWSSFQCPTNTLLQGQSLPVGVPLTATASEQDLSPGAYRLLLTTNDALLQWATAPNASFVTYWALSGEGAAVRDSSRAVHSMKVNASGLYLLAGDGKDSVLRLLFDAPPAQGESRIVKVDPSGRLRALTTAYSPTAAAAAAGATLRTVWAAPAKDCHLPLPCGSLHLCTPGTNGSSCICPDSFSNYTGGSCSPADTSVALPVSCVAGDSASSSSTARTYRYTSLRHGTGYFLSKFALPVTTGDELPACRGLCSTDCSCLGFVYKNSSRSCFLVQNQIGSLLLDNDTDVAACFIKTLLKALPRPRGHGSSAAGGGSSLSSITIICGIALPSVAAVFITFLVYVMGVQWLKNKRVTKNDGGDGCRRRRSWFMLHVLSYSGAPSAAASEGGESDQDEVVIPGLPARFTYADLEAATNGFRSQIGSGGFGTVYRGELPDRSTVAVKRMNELGTQGRREFLKEIAVIGDVHHVNLVKLRGFCAEGAARQLVYEYMNRGSLDQCLFRAGAGAAALEWPDRLRVCVGAARGLAYLHAGCDRKILHCDVKPENILLDDRGGVKIADFGMAKLMNREQSGLFTAMRGTRGYLAPEWLTNAAITEKADVYSFGMVLLEVLRGRKNCTADGAELGSTTYSPALAVELHEEGRCEELLDPRLEGRTDAAEVTRVVRVALWCLQEDATLRPAMTAVSAMLDGTMEVEPPTAEHLGYLRLYGGGIVHVRGGGGVLSSDMTGGVSSRWSPTSYVSAQQLSGPR